MVKDAAKDSATEVSGEQMKETLKIIEKGMLENGELNIL